jgi:CheY-like chemotaxis protein
MVKSATPLRILLADDDADDRAIFRDALRDAKINAELTTITDGAKLMKHLHKAGVIIPDIIFLDINMPCKNGKECLREIRTTPSIAAVPVVMLTTSVYEKDVDETFAYGANCYLCKRDFDENEVIIIQKLFAPGWQKRLHEQTRETFVLTAPSSKQKRAEKE